MKVQTGLYGRVTQDAEWAAVVWDRPVADPVWAFNASEGRVAAFRVCPGSLHLLAEPGPPRVVCRFSPWTT